MNSRVDRALFFDRQRLRKLVEESDFDVVLATSLENVTYISGLYDPGMRTLPNRMHIVVWPAEGEAVFIVPKYRIGVETFIKDVRGYDFYVRHELLKDPRGRVLVHRWPMSLLAEVLEEKGLAAGRIGLEKSTFPAGACEELRGLMPSAEFVDCESLFVEARMLKTPAEIELLQRAGLATERAIQVGFELTQPGDTSKSIANSIGSAITKFGAEEVAFLQLDVLRNGRRLNYLHEPVEIREGDLVRVDAGGYFAGYLSDVARMAVVGAPSREQRSTYERLLSVQKRIVYEIIKPGIPGSELFRQVDAVFEEAGFKTPWGMIVHGIGLYIHERPWIRELESYELESGVVLCVEAISHGPEKEMWHIEDLIVITDEGATVLTTFSSTDDLFTIG